MISSRSLGANDARVTIRALLIEDNEDDVALLVGALRHQRRGRVILDHVLRVGDGLRRLDASRYDVVILDLTLPDADGLTALEAVLEKDPAVPVVVFTGAADSSLASDALRQGAQDYIQKAEADGEVMVRILEFAVLRARSEQDRRASRMQRLEVQQMRHLTRARARMFNVAAHQFNTPITTMQLQAQMTRADAEARGDAVAVRRAELLQQAVDRLHGIVNDLIVMARVEADELTLTMEPRDLRAVVARVLADVADATGASEPPCVIDPTSEPVLRGYVDEHHFARALSVLIGYLVGLSMPGGQVVVRLHRVGDLAYLVCSLDHARSAEDLEEALSFPTQPRLVGPETDTALHIYTASRVIEAHGGWIELPVRQEFGEVQEVVIVVPCATGDFRVPEAPRPEGAARGPDL